MTTNLYPIEAHRENLTRVDKQIRQLVYDFCLQNLGKDFFMYDLEYFVLMHRMITPGSAGRILRLLKQENVINYQQLSRAESKYKVTYVSGKGQLGFAW